MTIDWIMTSSGQLPLDTDGRELDTSSHLAAHLLDKRSEGSDQINMKNIYYLFIHL